MAKILSRESRRTTKHVASLCRVIKCCYRPIKSARVVIGIKRNFECADRTLQQVAVSDWELLVFNMAFCKRCIFASRY